MKTMPFLIFTLSMFFFLTPSAFSKDRSPFIHEPINVVFSPEGKVVGNLKVKKGKVILFLNGDPKVKWIKGHEWGIYNRKDKLLGKAERKNNLVKIYNEKDELLGTILRNNKFRTRGAKLKNVSDIKKRPITAPINTHAAKLYLQVLKVIDQIK